MRYIFAALIALSVLLIGCASPLRGAHEALVALSDTATKTEPLLEAEYRSQQEACMTDHAGVVESGDCVRAVRDRWKPVKVGYRSFRSAWVAADAVLRTAEAAHALDRAVDIDAVLHVVTAALDAAAAYRDLVLSMKAGAK
jgi:hypothetical protein